MLGSLQSMKVSAYLVSMQDFLENFKNDATVKIPWVRRDLCRQRVLVMEWINGRRCTDPRGIRSSGLDVNSFITGGVVSALRQLLEVCCCAVHFTVVNTVSPCQCVGPTVSAYFVLNRRKTEETNLVSVHDAGCQAGNRHKMCA